MIKDEVQKTIVFCADGTSPHTRRWILETKQRGFRVILITRLVPDIPYCETHLISGYRSKLGWFFGIFKLRRIIKAIKPDLVHGHYITSYGTWAVISGAKRVILTAWGSDILVTPNKSRILRLLTKFTLNLACLITADSTQQIFELRKYVKPEKLMQIQWGVNLEQFPLHATPVRKTLNIISLRSLSGNYNIDSIINAFSIFLKRNPTKDCRLLIAGDGPYSKKLKALAIDLGVNSKIFFLGLVPESIIINTLINADISITIPTSDGTAMSLLESMAAGLPIIASDIAPNRQWINEDGGILVSPESPEAVAFAIEKLANSEQLRHNMGERNRGLIIKSASRKNNMDHMADIYSKCINKKT